MEKIISTTAMVMGLLIMICYFYQGVYVVIGLIFKPKTYVASKDHKYAVLIAARNESLVIANLIESIKNQNYPTELLQVFVVADNCTDTTASVAKKAGAIVYERENTLDIGKGYALNFLLEKINQEEGLDAYDGYFIFDADNILEADYVTQMNGVFDSGYRVVTSYRNSKNYDSNWISAGSALWFLREAKYINNVRMMLGVSCAVSGTGFLVHNTIMMKNNGWNYHLLTEDIQFSADSIVHGEKIGYCGQAVFYDEQPIRFADSWNQRIRWSKGFYQVFFQYGKDLFKRAFLEFNFSCYDMFITLMPSLGVFVVTAVLGTVTVVMSIMNTKLVLMSLIRIAILAGLNMYGTLFLLGLITTITEWNNIYCKSSKKIGYVFTFPIFMLTYIPISFVAIFSKASWKPIQHSVVKTVGEIRKE